MYDTQMHTRHTGTLDTRAHPDAHANTIHCQAHSYARSCAPTSTDEHEIFVGAAVVASLTSGTQQDAIADAARKASPASQTRQPTPAVCT